jgi:hypothetical protein
MKHSPCIKVDSTQADSTQAFDTMMLYDALRGIVAYSGRPAIGLFSVRVAARAPRCFAKAVLRVRVLLSCRCCSAILSLDSPMGFRLLLYHVTPRRLQ